jgi:short-subunit dehydrogenase
MKKILITGASGQDGQILAYKLAKENHVVIGLGKGTTFLSNSFRSIIIIL